MEMHQIRYFLAVTRTLNFTRAAEECNVAQPSLTRAVKLLEDELGGELFRRERNLSHLTELGTRMLPLLQQCYESAVSAKSLATSIKRGSIAPLALALSRTINIEFLVPHLTELTRSLKGLELKFLRGSGAEIAEHMKKGDAELAVAGPLGEMWERLDAWPLFEERFRLWCKADHGLTGRNRVSLADLASERFLVRGYCEQASALAELLRGKGIDVSGGHKVANETDLGALLASGAGIAIAPASLGQREGTASVAIDDLKLGRKVLVYGVAGRSRSPAAAALLKLLRAADWSHYSS
jgi:DNA-binding transcriptional LysR family regulator